MNDLISQRGQVPLAPAPTSTSAGPRIESTHVTASSVSFFKASEASSGFTAFSDTPSALLASSIDIPASTAKDFAFQLYPNNPITGRESCPTDVILVSNTSDPDPDSLMKRPGRKSFGGFLAFALSYVTLSGVATHLNKGANQAESLDNARWVATSKNWLDRQICGWVGLCGTFHLNEARWTWDGVQDDPPVTLPDISDWWVSGTEDPTSWSGEERRQREIPQYVWDHAPYVHLFSGEEFWPCDLAEHLTHISPYTNYTKILDIQHDLNLTNLDELNQHAGHGMWAYLQSDDNVEERPTWLGGAKNIPNSPNLADDEDDDAPWPDRHDSDALNSDSAEQHALAEDAQTPEMEMVDNDEPVLPSLVRSTDGRCGGNSGFTCKGSKFGHCCSIYGWCGKGEAYCGEACDALSGKCKDPFAPSPKPHADLRRRMLEIRESKHPPSRAGRSSAPAILVVVLRRTGS